MNAAYRRSAATTEKADQSDKAEKDGTRLRNREQLEVVPDQPITEMTLPSEIIAVVEPAAATFAGKV